MSWVKGPNYAMEKGQTMSLQKARNHVMGKRGKGPNYVMTKQNCCKKSQTMS